MSSSAYLNRPNSPSLSSRESQRSALSMDEAYRRLGHKLSQRVGGGTDYYHRPRPIVMGMGTHPQSAFTDRQQQQQQHDHPPQPNHPLHPVPIPEFYNRTTKVAKVRYTDHGSHQETTSMESVSVLKRLTHRARETFHKLESSRLMTTPEKGNKKRHSPSELVSPHQHALSQLALGEAAPPGRQPQQPPPNDKKGLLSSVLEDTVMEQNLMQVAAAAAAAAADSKSVADPTQQKATKDSDSTTPSTATAHSNTAEAPATTTATASTQRKCLTQPTEPIASEGTDNSEGNLIVFEDFLICPSNIHTLSGRTNQDHNPRFKNLRVRDLLGQGTFAQVFECECLETGEVIALKVVKNKQAYTRQAAVEIEVFKALMSDSPSSSSATPSSATPRTNNNSIRGSSYNKDNMVQLQCYFMFRNHLCMVFELLGLNLYEVLKRRQFRGLPLSMVRTLIHQAMDGVKDLSQKAIVHCDLKPENILLSKNQDAVIHAGEREASSTAISNDATKNAKLKQNSARSSRSRSSRQSSGNNGSEGPINGGGGVGSTPSTEDTDVSTPSHSDSSSNTAQQPSVSAPSLLPRIKLIDFGSACFEGSTTHTYIQSRFYRSPEVLVGLPYDSAIDMWSLGCVAAELYLGLPILPGVHEHDQLGRICEMIGVIPDWMLEQGSKSSKFFVKRVQKPAASDTKEPAPPARTPSPPGKGTRKAGSQSSWRIKTQQEYIKSLSASEIKKKGGLAKLEKQPTNRYFKRKKLGDIIILHGSATEDREQLGLFVHFLLGILDPDPWKRWTAYQASQHPFLSGSTSHRRRSSSEDVRTNHEFDIYWVPPWDPSICRRKLLNVQKTREKQQALRRNHPRQDDLPEKLRRDLTSPAMGGASGSTSTSRVTAMTDAMSLSRHSNSHSERTSPPSSLGVSTSNSTAQSTQQVPANLTGSLGSIMALHQAEVSSGVSLPPQHNFLVPSSASFDFSHASLGETGMPPMVSPSMHGVTYGDLPAHQVHLMSGTQSLSGLSYDGMQVQVDADFGYALQRPGVVPGSVSGSYSSLSQNLPPMGYSPHHAAAVVAAAAAAPRVGTAPNRNMRATAASSAGSSLGGRRRNIASQSPRQFMHTSSIREDPVDYQPGGIGSTLPASAGTSLLSQQMKDEAAKAGPASQDMMAHDNNNATTAIEAYILQQQQQQQQLLQAGYLGQNNMYGGGGYYTYIAADGTPMLSALPPAMLEQQQQQQQYLGVYGVAPPTMYHEAATSIYPSTYALGQPPPPGMEQQYTQQQQPQQRQVQGIPYGQYRGLSM